MLVLWAARDEIVKDAGRGMRRSVADVLVMKQDEVGVTKGVRYSRRLYNIIDEGDEGGRVCRVAGDTCGTEKVLEGGGGLDMG